MNFGFLFLLLCSNIVSGDWHIYETGQQLSASFLKLSSLFAMLLFIMFLQAPSVRLPLLFLLVPVVIISAISTTFLFCLPLINGLCALSTYLLLLLGYWTSVPIKISFPDLVVSFLFVSLPNLLVALKYCRFVMNALKAKEFYRRDVEYIVRNGKALIINEVLWEFHMVFPWYCFNLGTLDFFLFSCVSLSIGKEWMNHTFHNKKVLFHSSVLYMY